jgi:Cu(I)/Ag(I) efflux system membrane fusion protein
MREVSLGPALGNSYIVEEGLQAGEEIAVHGTFSIDAAAQLAGKPSMMNPEGGVVMTGHDHGGHSAMLETPSSPTPEKVSISDKAITALQPLFRNYFELKNYLVDDDFENALQAGKVMRQTRDKVDRDLFSCEARKIWISNENKLKDVLQNVHHFQTIEELRKAFQTISNTMIDITESLGPSDEIVYVQRCPMADNNKGANWLSREKEINNPYFGASMLKCGEIIKTIQ